MQALEARYKSGQGCHCRCDLGEKKSPCLRKVVFSCACAHARGTWSQRDDVARVKDFAKARTLVAKHARPWSGARHPNACLRELVFFAVPLFERDIREESEAGRRGLRPKVKRSRVGSRRAENKLAYKITIPVLFDVPLPPPIVPLLPFFLQKNGFIYLTATSSDRDRCARNWDDIRRYKITDQSHDHDSERFSLGVVRRCFCAVETLS